MAVNKRKIGSKYEALAAEYLQKKGYRIVERNFRSPFGEIDIIAEKDGVIVYVEIKYRSSMRYGDPLEAVDFRKQRIITKVAWYYLLTHGGNEWTPCRFDVLAITGNTIRLYQNAFEAYHK